MLLVTTLGVRKVKDMDGYGGYGGYGARGGRPMAPVSVGEEFTATIEAVGEKGDGICKKKGFVLFVPGVKEGQSVKIRVTKVLRRVGFAEVVGPGEPSQSSEPKQEQKSEEEPAEEQSEEKQEASEEDTDDFGDDESEK